MSNTIEHETFAAMKRIVANGFEGIISTVAAEHTAAIVEACDELTDEAATRGLIMGIRAAVRDLCLVESKLSPVVGKLARSFIKQEAIALHQGNEKEAKAFLNLVEDEVEVELNKLTASPKLERKAPPKTKSAEEPKPTKPTMASATEHLTFERVEARFKQNQNTLAIAGIVIADIRNRKIDMALKSQILTFVEKAVDEHFQRVNSAKSASDWVSQRLEQPPRRDVQASN